MLNIRTNLVIDIESCFLVHCTWLTIFTRFGQSILVYKSPHLILDFKNFLPLSSFTKILDINWNSINHLEIWHESPKFSGVQNIAFKNKITYKMLNCWKAMKQNISMMFIFNEIKFLSTSSLSSFFCFTCQHFFSFIHINIVTNI